jgi:hypothetical protein
LQQYNREVLLFDVQCTTGDVGNAARRIAEDLSIDTSIFCWSDESDFSSKWDIWRTSLLNFTAPKLFSNYNLSKQQSVSKGINSNTMTAMIFFLEAMFCVERLPRGQLLSGVVSTDGYSISLGTFLVCQGVRTELSNGERDQVGILLHEGSQSTLLRGPPSWEIDRLAKTGLTFRPAVQSLEILESIERLWTDKEFVVDRDFGHEEETEKGLPKWIPRVYQSSMPIPNIVIGIDVGETYEAVIACGTRKKAGPYSMASLAFSAKTSRSSKVKRFNKATTIRRKYGMQTTDKVKPTTKLKVESVFLSGNAVLRHKNKSHVTDEVKYQRMVSQVSAL